MELQFSGLVFSWRGPSPYHFVEVPEAESTQLDTVVRMVSYGWGMIPVSAQIGSTTFTTALIPKDGNYLLPVKDAVRKAESLEVGDEVTITMTVRI